ncbi:hypothetical protein BG003_000474 [Podila horticola]|nr:hypothetical protein BG003_000474 [Podila horticola]
MTNSSCVPSSMNPRSPPTLSSLPNEILDTIFQHLALCDVLQFVCVSRAWQTHLTPYVWRTINIKSPAQLSLFQTPTVQQALTRNAGNVHHLHITYRNLCAIFLPKKILPQHIQPKRENIGGFRPALFTSLRTLEWINTPDPFLRNHHGSLLLSGSHDSGLDNRFASLVQQQTSSSALRKLVIDVPICSKLLQQLVAENMPRLRHLEVRDRGPELDLKSLLEKLSESIKTVFVARPGA